MVAPFFQAIIQRQLEGRLDFGNFTNQRVQGCLRNSAGGFQVFEQVRAKTSVNGLDGANQIGEKTQRVIIQLVEREPGDGLSALFELQAGLGRFSKSGRGGDQGQFPR